MEQAGRMAQVAQLVKMSPGVGAVQIGWSIKTGGALLSNGGPAQDVSLDVGSSWLQSEKHVCQQVWKQAVKWSFMNMLMGKSGNWRIPLGCLYTSRYCKSKLQVLYCTVPLWRSPGSSFGSGGFSESPTGGSITGSGGCSSFFGKQCVQVTCWDFHNSFKISKRLQYFNLILEIFCVTCFWNRQSKGPRFLVDWGPGVETLPQMLSNSWKPETISSFQSRNLGHFLSGFLLLRRLRGCRCRRCRSFSRSVAGGFITDLGLLHLLWVQSELFILGHFLYKMLL